MSTICVYGTLTSPYVRRVRIVAQELGLTHDFVDAATETGQAAMRSVNPLWKVPTATIDGAVVFDSRVICEALLADHGPGPLANNHAALDVRNEITTIDGVLDALINTFYLAKDGVTAQQSSYMAKQHARARASMEWLDEQVAARAAASSQFGLREVAMCTALEWMAFRNTYPVQDHAALSALVAAHADRPSMLATRPPA